MGIAISGNNTNWKYSLEECFKPRQKLFKTKPKFIHPGGQGKSSGQTKGRGGWTYNMIT